MSLSKAAILVEVNNRTGRSETDIDSILKAVLLDLTIDFPFLKGEFYRSTIAGTPDYGVGDTIRNVELVKIDDKDPLIKINTWEEYQQLIAEETEADRDEPTRYIIHDRILYLWPTPDAIYTLTIFGSYIERNVDTIDLEDNFEEVLIQGCCFKLYESKSLGASPPAVLHLNLYKDAVDKLKRIYSESAERIEYNDI